MLRRYPYFRQPGACADGSPVPRPLSFSVKRVIRFEEVDSLGVVWHGRYPSYFEDARVALGARLGIGYDTLIRQRTPAPVKQMYIEYISPLRFGRTCDIQATIHWSEAARMNLSYSIRDEEGGLCADGYTVQLFTTADGELLLEQPDFYAAFCREWKSGRFAVENGETPDI